MLKYQQHASFLPWRLRWRFIADLYLLTWQNGRLSPTDEDHELLMLEYKARLRGRY
jgi:hypothetical protein